jgi:hypothetical protein
MIKQTDVKCGDRVHYIPNHGKIENGIVKSIPVHTTRGLFVVYNCNEDWKNYKDYTAALTDTDKLYLNWKEVREDGEGKET